MDMDLHSRIRERLRQLGRAAQSDRAFSLAAGLPSEQMREIKRGVTPGGERLVKIAAALDWTVPELMGAPKTAPPATPSVGRPPPGTPQHVLQPPPPFSMSEDVPVYGVAAGSSSGSFQLEDGAVDYVRRPPGIAHQRDAYALFVMNDSMYPRHRPGELIYVAPSRPPKIGDDVIVWLKPTAPGEPEQCFIKTLVRRTADGIHVEQFNPPQTVTYPRAEVLRVHKVMTVAELVGA